MQKAETGEADVKYIHQEITHNLTSPQIIVPEIMRLLNPKSVIDIGCGTGTFLYVFEQCGVSDFVGVDGEWARGGLVVGRERFVAGDLEKEFDLGREFDLVVCLEVAEHVSETSADAFVRSLVNHGGTILFSAAIPNQGGQNHINEQNFDYWQRKFKGHGYAFYDVLRPLFWNRADVQWWYKQNMFLVVHESVTLPPVMNARKMPDDADTQAHPGCVEFYRNLFQEEAEKTRKLQTELKDIVWGEKRPGFYVKGLLKTIRNLFK